ncbi:tyrosine-protein kinase receptor Tie-1-like [Orbicella faveolata]|uniref:tyrosine-protein kinase receptor Tie-1-like n=1 Tax=Orbicella faveolata TaxID=48498 RepID=UPI0009E57D23|nr:tyrosine-protein kinase receptor Tie-1-like [Orbicella faveolata]
MARDVSKDGEYIKTTEGRIPWLWMPTEALRGRFTTMSDVWSFGVVLWEIVTLGQLPYKGIKGVVELYGKLKDGIRLEKPPHCSGDLYNVMLLCWQNCPEERPTFKELRAILHNILHTQTRTYINVEYFDEQAMTTGWDHL